MVVKSELVLLAQPPHLLLGVVMQRDASTFLSFSLPQAAQFLSGLPTLFDELEHLLFH